MHDRTSSQRNGEGAEAAAILHCLGNFRLSAVGDGAELSLRGRKARALIAYLVLNGGPVNRERLAGLLWSERGEDQARASLRNTLLELRALGNIGQAVLSIERELVGVVPSRIETDLGRLLAWSADGALAAVDACLASWDGQILADLSSIDGGFDDWLAGERTRLQGKVFAAVTAALETALGSERVDHTRSIADKLLQVEPTNEVVVRLAMRADRAANDVSAIRRRYKRLEDQLRAEFNATPTADTRRLHDDLVAGSTTSSHVNRVAASPRNGHAERAASSDPASGATEASAPPASKVPTWRRVAAAAIVAAAGAAAIAAIASNDWTSRYTPDLVEVRPLALLKEQPELQSLAQQTNGSLRQVLASHDVAITDGAVSPSSVPEFRLGGLLEKTGGDVSVTLYLDNVQDGQTLWSHRFARANGESERLRDEIGAHAAYMIGCTLRQRRLARLKPTVAALKIYLETCEPAFVWQSDETLLAVGQRLVEVAPNDAYGHGLVALANAALGDVPDLTDAEVRMFRDRARRAASRASQLDATSSLSLIASAMALPPAESWQKRDALLRRSQNDYAFVSIAYVQHLRASGRLNEALRVLEVVLAQAPLSAGAGTLDGVLQMQLGDHEKAHHLFEKALELWPNGDAPRWYRFVNLVFYGKPDDALSALQRERQTFGLTLDEAECWRTFIDARRAHRPDVATVRNACANQGSDYRQRILAALGDTNGALEALRIARLDWGGATISLFYPEMKSVRHDARFMSAIADSGLVSYWATSELWPDFCSDKDLPYSCKDAAAEVLKRNKVPRD